MLAVIERNRVEEDVSLINTVTPSNVSKDVFAVLKKNILVDDPSRQTQGIVWSVSAFNVNGCGFAVALKAPLRAGKVIAVTGSFR